MKTISENMWPEMHTVKAKGSDDILGRQDMSAYCYPKYDEYIRLKIPGLGFTLSKDQAILLKDVLTEILESYD